MSTWGFGNTIFVDPRTKARITEGGVGCQSTELTLLTLLACLCLGVAWAYEADLFAVVFAAEAAFAGFEAVRRSL
jgi:hypothetical protein